MLRVRVLLPAALLAFASCRSIKSDVRVYESMSLVEQRLGQRPGWVMPWDEEAPPDWDGNGVLELDAALNFALRNNRELRADVESIGMANADLVQAGLLTNPTVNFMVMLPSGGGQAMLRGAGAPLQPLQDLWLRPARQNVARAALQQTILRVADRAIETALAVKRTYARIQFAQRALELIQANMRTIAQSTDVIQSRLVAGRATQVELTLSRIRLQRLQSELLALDAEHRRLKREMMALLGLADAEDNWTVAPLDELVTPSEPPAAEADLVDLGALHRLDLKAAEWSLRGAERRITLMAREGWPMVSLGLSFERAATGRSTGGRAGRALSNAVAAGAAGAVTGMPMQPSMPMRSEDSGMSAVDWTIGPMIDLEIPIFDQNQAQVAKALHEQRQSRALYEARYQDVTRAIREAHIANQAAYDQVELYRDMILPEVERNLALAEQSYVAGQESLTVYLQVQEDVFATRLRALEFLRDYYISRAELERAVGGSLQFPIEPLPETRPALPEAGPDLPPEEAPPDDRAPAVRE